LARRLAQRWGELLWPGAPVWQPVSALALSLVIGLTAGALVPAVAASSASSDQVVAALDTTATVTDLDKDL
jgi:small basic protein